MTEKYIPQAETPDESAREAYYRLRNTNIIDYEVDNYARKLVLDTFIVRRRNKSGMLYSVQTRVETVDVNRDYL